MQISYNLFDHFCKKKKKLCLLNNQYKSDTSIAFLFLTATRGSM